jgi:hypothetical protein
MKFLRDLAVCEVTLLVLVVCAMGQQPSASSMTPGQVAGVYAGLVGDWVGQLEYRDFTSNERVFLPTWLSVTQLADGKSAQFVYIYDDGPNKTVREVSVVTFDPASGIVSLTSDRDRSSDSYKGEGLAEFAKTGRGKVLLTGTGVENDKKVDVRITITVRRNLYTYVKDTRLPGEDFKFRDGYTFTRKEPPK